MSGDKEIKDDNKGMDNSFYIAGSDNPNIQMTEMKMDESNYRVWVIHMKRTLSIKNKLGFITGSIQEPVENDEKYNVWNRCNESL